MNSPSASPQVREIPIREIDGRIIDELASQLCTRHHLDGAFVGGTFPSFMVRLPKGSPKIRSGDLRVSVKPFGSIFGTSLDIDIHFVESDEHAHICVPTDHPKFKSLVAREFYIVFSDCGVPSVAFHFDFAGAVAEDGGSFVEASEAIAKCRPLIWDQGAHFWDVLSQSEHLERYFTAADHLSVGWVRAYKTLVTELQKNFAELESRNPLVGPFDDLESDLLRKLFVAHQSHGNELSKTIVGVRKSLSVGSEGKELERLALLSRSASSLSKHPTLSAYRGPLIDLCVVLAWSSPFTDCGKKFPWRDTTLNTIRHFQITPDEFPEWFQPKLYWLLACDGTVQFELGRILTGADVPCGLLNWERNLSQFPRASGIEEDSTFADNLLDDAIEHKTWTIPPKAVVQLRIGIFTHIELHEIGGNVFCVFRTEKGEFYTSVIAPKDHWGSFRVSEEIEPDADKRQAIEVKVHGILCAIIRDFWVVEEREKVFSTKLQSFRRGRRPMREDKPRVVYLPRINYTGIPNLAVANKELGYPERRRHNVGGHLRKVGAASRDQLILAERYGFPVPDGHTFVRPHLRGKGTNEVIYKSRSALQLLYRADGEITGETNVVDWFQFERDVNNVMVKLGFQVHHKAADRHGDGGVDILATKGTDADFDLINWVIQCKCWKPTRKVTPSVVRELLGVLTGYPHGTRGMIVTTSSFSSGARENAEASDIRLVDGEEFAKLIGAH